MSVATINFKTKPRIDFEQFPRISLCHQPTPIEEMPRLTAHLNGPKLFIKRDDCTGLATGGNKTRKLEFLMGDALRVDADLVVTQGAVQSNHVRQTAAAACRLGLDCHVLLERRVPDRDPAYEETGNVFLDKLFGVTYEFRPDGLDMNAEAEAVTERLRAEGRRPYFIPGGGSNAIGALGYASCAQEIADQCAETGHSFQWLVMGTGSSGTQAGLVAGFHVLGYDLPVMGVSVRQPHERQVTAVHATTEKTLEKLGGTSIEKEKILVDDGYVGEGYGLPAETTLEAIHLTARQEGILLDPVYSAKGMAGLIGLIRQGFFSSDDNVLFLHTGGSTSLFAYEDQILGSMG
ncbi:MULTISPECIES: D-cysteine desulfhydrase [unclassified Roseibium]|uniref:D-cysteine desulfhydrase n=1 Tax=unclassified Roseibium TaxID=2629323 RepID=UPI00273F2424|nr:MULTISPECIES: D-cysteine desulfhydrase [unclassified Roseibium]